MWSHLLPLAGPDIHDVHIAGSASKPYACVVMCSMIVPGAQSQPTSVFEPQGSPACSPAVEAGPGEAGGVSPLDEPSSAVAPPAARCITDYSNQLTAYKGRAQLNLITHRRAPA